MTQQQIEKIFKTQIYAEIIEKDFGENIACYYNPEELKTIISNITIDYLPKQYLKEINKSLKNK